MDYHLMSTQECLDAFKTDMSGLSSQECQKRLDKYGQNKFVEKKKVSLFVRFFKQLADPMIIVLLCAAIISLFVAFANNESFADVIIIMSVVIINAILGVYQESKAEKSLEALKQMSVAKTKVIRDGQITEIDSQMVVPGDIVYLEAGDIIPADGRLLDCAMLKIDESPLTGESDAISKIVGALELKNNDESIEIADRKNMAYMGTTAVYGNGKMLVTDTGMKTRMGQIAQELNDVKEKKTPLQIRMGSLSKALTWIVLIICLVIFALQVIKAPVLSFNIVLESFMIAVTLAVAAIPEGLPAIVTVSLSIGVSKMAKRNAIVRKLTAVETLGCAQIICTDKTGTLTQNKMTVVDFYGNDESMIKRAMALCNDATATTGDPTEIALYNWAKIDKSQFERIDESPFDSDRKMMSTLNIVDGDTIQFTKGAPDVILSKCCNCDVDKIKEQINNMTAKAYRVLACAYRKADSINEDDMTFIGIVGMIDPVRPEVNEAIKLCKDAGITPIMITGDHIDTAKAIAKELNLLENNKLAITGAELEKMSDSELSENIAKIGVYARVQPQHKTRIVKAWQESGFVVAMTGDGVNDAPSIKNADIGVGMGITGTDVSKNAADIVLSDDNFATIVGAVEEGRRIYDNIVKCTLFLLGSNIGEVLGVFIATIFSFTILRPVHLLWVNLVTDCVPALALGVEHKEPNIMSRSPRKKNSGIFSDGFVFDLVYQGFVITLLIMISYFIGIYFDTGMLQICSSEHGISMAFLTMSMVGCFHSVNLRSRRLSIFQLKTKNWILLISVLVSLLLTTIVCEVPVIANAFRLVELGVEQWVISVCLGLAIIPVVEIVKFFQRKFEKTKINNE